MMSMRAKFNHVNKGVGVGRGLESSSVLGDGSGQVDMSYQKWLEESCIAETQIHT